MKPGRAGTMTHDYKRHGTTTLFATGRPRMAAILGPRVSGLLTRLYMPLGDLVGAHLREIGAVQYCSRP